MPILAAANKKIDDAKTPWLREGFAERPQFATKYVSAMNRTHGTGNGNNAGPAKRQIM